MSNVLLVVLQSKVAMDLYNGYINAYIFFHWLVGGGTRQTTYRGSPVTSWYLANEVEGMCYLLCCKVRLLWICTMGMSKLVCFTSFTLACWGGHIRLLTEDPQ